MVISWIIPWKLGSAELLGRCLCSAFPVGAERMLLLATPSPRTVRLEIQNCRRSLGLLQAGSTGLLPWGKLRHTASLSLLGRTVGRAWLLQPSVVLPLVRNVALQRAEWFSRVLV